MDQDLENIYGYLLSNLLQSTNSIPLKPLWLCYLDSVPGVEIANRAELFDRNGNAGSHQFQGGHSNASQAAGTGSINYRGAVAALIAQEINIPGDVLRVERTDVGLNSGGYMGGVVGSQREHLQPADIAYIETGYSFTDFVLRPWMLRASYESLKYVPRTNITMVNYAKTGKTQFIPRKITTLHNCVPINIDTETYHYKGNELIIRKVRWHYDSYTVASGKRVLDPVEAVSYEDYSTYRDDVRAQDDSYETYDTTPIVKTVEDDVQPQPDGSDTPEFQNNLPRNLPATAGPPRPDARPNQNPFPRNLPNGSVQQFFSNIGADLVQNLPGEVADAIRGIPGSIVETAGARASQAVGRVTGAVRSGIRGVSNTITGAVNSGFDSIEGAIFGDGDVVPNPSDVPSVFPGALSEGEVQIPSGSIQSSQTFPDDQIPSKDDTPHSLNFQTFPDDQIPPKDDTPQNLSLIKNDVIPDPDDVVL